MQIRARDIVLVDPRTLKRNPKNRNKHSQEQIDHLVKQFEYQGFRQPVVVSNRSGLVVAGHGRLEAALKMGAEQIPAVYQDFETEEQEYAYGIADNSTADWAELDLSGINLDLPELGPDFDIDLLGIKDFSLEPADKSINNTSTELDLGSFDNFQHECPKCGFEWNDNGTT
jgi:hypothetical protein